MATIEYELRAGDRSLKRLEIVLAIILVWVLLIIGRLVHLQILQHEEYARQATQQQNSVSSLSAPRGNIYDREGKALAVGVPVRSMCVNPQLVRDSAFLSEVLARFLKLNAREVKSKIDEAAATKRGFLWVKRKVSVEEATRVLALGLVGVEVREETIRSYPKKTLAAHILGSVDHDGKGNAGIELGLEDDLEGIPGSARMMNDVRRRAYDALVESKPLPGKHITLTIDERIQYEAETELKDAVINHHCKTGSVVVMDPNTGDILAMANYPTFDPNQLPTKDLSPRLNLAIAAPYEPGSVFKVITLSSALENTHLGPESPINCLGGRMNLYGREIHEAHGGFGVIPMRSVLAKSSNIGAIQIGLTTGQKKLYKTIDSFGFGKKTGLPLPAESGGLVRNEKRWTKTSIGSVAMGHEVLTTTLQLAQAATALANDGVMVKPRIVKRRQRPGEVVEQEPAAERIRIMSGRNAALMREMMRDVVRPGGTAAVGVKPAGYTTGGKTGSAQMIDPVTHKYLHGRYNASFMGIAPLNKPAVVVVVTLIGSSEFGGKVAGPVFNKVASAALRVLDVPKDDLESLEKAHPGQPELAEDAPIAALGEPPVEEPENASVLVASGGAPSGPRVPNFLGKTLREVLVEAQEAGLAVDPRGNGISKMQRPEPGGAMRPGERIVIQFAK